MENGAQSQDAGPVPTYYLWVNGKKHDGRGELLKVTDPATGELYAYAHHASKDDVDHAVLIAHQTFASGVWSRASRHTRADILDHVAHLLQSNLDKLIEVEVRQTGRAAREMAAQLPTLPKWFKYFAAVARTEERPVLPTTGKLHNWVDRQPLGVVALIAPFNHPLLIAAKKIAPALAAGNSIVLKPSELTPCTAILLGEIFKQGGIPDGVFNVLPGLGHITGKELVEHPLIRKVDFTGGTRAGKAIGVVTGGNMVRLTAELGGKAPVVVFASAKVELAVNGVCFGAFIASGQTCVAATRIIVHARILSHFMQRLLEKIEVITSRMGSPSSPQCSMGPVISLSQLNKMDEIVADSVASGNAEILCGGERMEGVSQLDGTDFSKGYYYPPTVLVSTRGHSITDTRVWQEEAFGPIIAVISFETEAQAIALANDSPFGLGAGIWTSEMAQAHHVAQEIEAGIVWVNTHHRNDPSSPWGGLKPDSGVGSENGIEAYHAYTKTKSTLINYADVEEQRATEDWFRDDAQLVRYG